VRGTSSLLRLGLAMGALLVLVAAVGPTLAPYDPAAPVAPQLAEPMPPAAPFYLGTDDLGRDVLSRLLHGARISLLVGVVAMVVTMVIGTAIGLAAGYFGGGVDVVLMRVTDVMLAFPGLLLAVALVAVLRPSVWTIFVVIAALSTSGTILLDAGLSFLGIGVPPPTPTWGRMIQEATAYYRVAPWLMLFPGAAVLYAVLTFNFIAYGLAGDGRAPGA